MPRLNDSVFTEKAIDRVFEHTGDKGDEVVRGGKITEAKNNMANLSRRSGNWSKNEI